MSGTVLKGLGDGNWLVLAGLGGPFGQLYVVPGAILELHAARAFGGVSPGVNSPLTTQWYDTSGHGNHGTLTNFAGTTASGYAGSGTLADPYRLVFNGAV